VSRSPGPGRTLLRVARAAIAELLGGPAVPLPDEGWLYRPGAAFVTLRQQGRLRGCVGSLEARRPLGEDVQRNARAAAFHDPRFARLAADELPGTHLEVTLLSALEPLEARSEAQALERLRPGVDGLVLSWGGRQGTFIPQMWEVLPAPVDFLRQLKGKAGLPANFWHPDVRLQRFTAEKWKEDEPPVG
jgi:AmmeMemoRadiSam system protein A